MDRKLILVTQPTRLEELIYRYNTEGQVKFYLEHHGADYADYRREHETYRAAVQTVRQAMEGLGRVQLLERRFVSRFLFGPEDLVVCVGRDGLIANVMKYLHGQALIGVNPEPARWDGVLLPFAPKDMATLLPEALRGTRQSRSITLAKVELSDGQSLYGVNDIFIGQRTHVSARYTLQLGRKRENQSSSGIIVSTGLGSTGWLKSVLAGAAGISRFYGTGERLPTDAAFAWDADQLFFAVREPYPSRATGADLVFGRITKNQTLQIVSQMPENGVIFSDGIEADALEFTAGLTATVSLASHQGKLLV